MADSIRYSELFKAEENRSHTHTLIPKVLPTGYTCSHKNIKRPPPLIFSSDIWQLSSTSIVSEGIVNIEMQEKKKSLKVKE